MRTRAQSAEEEAAAKRQREKVESFADSSNEDRDSPVVEEEQLGRGHRQRRAAEFYEDTQNIPRRMTRAATRQQAEPKATEDFNALYTSRGPPRPAAVAAIRAMRGSSDDESGASEGNQSDTNSSSTSSRGRAVTQHSRKGRWGERSGRGRVLFKSHRPEVKPSSPALTDEEDKDGQTTESDGDVAYDSASSTGFAKVTVQEAESATKARGSINQVMRRSQVLGRAFSGTAGVSAQDFQDRKTKVVGSLSQQDQQQQIATPTFAELGDITALAVDPHVNFSAIGGLPEHIVTLRETVLIPLLYPDLLRRLRLRPPRGLLFVGPPGTGKTLMARALANESTPSGKRISFFMRKGADILSKWVGESERQLRLLFDAARRSQPAVIFFDELDGLAPVRHAKIEQSHAALVSTLLALLDGLDDRGEVVVIGATNRVDTIDPALRRPGRFDRELYFPLPDLSARRQIVQVQLREAGARPGEPSTSLLSAADEAVIVESVAQETQGFSGADLAAVVTEGRLCALRRAIPQIYASSQRLKINCVDVTPRVSDFVLALRRIQPSLRRTSYVDNDLPQIDPVTLDLCRSYPERVYGALQRMWHPAAEALRARNEAAVEDNLAAVAARLARVPPLSIPGQMVLLVYPEEDALSSRAAYIFGGPPTDYLPTYSDAAIVAVAMVRALPTIPTRVLHLPQLLHAAPTAAFGETGSDGVEPSDVVTAFVRSLRRSQPCWAVLLGAPEWFSRADQEATANLRYSLSTLSDCDVGFVVPMDCASRTDVVSALLPPAMHYRTVEAPVSGAALYPDVAKALRRIMQQMVDCAIAFSDPHDCAPLELDEHPPAELSPLTAQAVKKQADEQKRIALDRWGRIDYKRKQLHHKLREWLVTLMHDPKYAAFINADLDLPEKNTHGAELLRRWRKHTRGRALGLADMMDKLDNEEYTALSQYNDDIDTIVGNVTSFFTRSERYVQRAKQLRSNTILNNHKISMKLVAFTEETKDEHEPIDSSSCSSESGSSKRLPPDDHDNAKTAPKPTRRRRRRAGFYSTPKRRRPATRNSAEPAKEAAIDGSVVNGTGSGGQGGEPRTSPDSARDEADHDPEGAEPLPQETQQRGKETFDDTRAPVTIDEVLAPLLRRIQDLLMGHPPPSGASLVLPLSICGLKRRLQHCLHEWALTIESSTAKSDPVLLARAALERHIFAQPS